VLRNWVLTHSRDRRPHNDDARACDFADFTIAMERCITRYGFDTDVIDAIADVKMGPEYVRHDNAPGACIRRTR